MDKLKVGDEVIVIVGKNRGSRGFVSARVDADHLLVNGVNVVKKAVKPNPSLGVVGGIVDKVMPINQSNVAIFNPQTGRADRVAFSVVEGKKIRIFKKGGNAIRVGL